MLVTRRKDVRLHEHEVSRAVFRSRDEIHTYDHVKSNILSTRTNRIGRRLQRFTFRPNRQAAAAVIQIK